MSQPIISVRGVGKEYRLGEFSSANTLRDALSGMFNRKGNGRLHPKGARRGARIWALKDISFDVAEGEVLGIIGANGAGKSTLLKILSRITEPTTGEIELRGRVASLLEVGTGFNDELTGRENIILNGAILGMAKREIDKKFDQIVDFSGVEKFIDTPTKHYSSGMKMRLAFAVAAHLEPEILIIDEVLAVGDAEFQRKCLGKMDEVAKAGRTVLFVSHNLAAVESLCTRALLLRAGQISFDGEVGEAIERYRSLFSSSSDRIGQARWLTDCRFAHPRDNVTATPIGGPIDFHMRFRTPEPTRRPKVGIVLRQQMSGEAVFCVNTEMLGQTPMTRDGAQFDCQFSFDRIDLVPGDYSVDVWLAANGLTFEVVRSAALLHVVESDIFGTGQMPMLHLGPLVVRPKHRLWPGEDDISNHDQGSGADASRPHTFSEHADDRRALPANGFSIVIPTYNRADLLAAAIDSATRLRVPAGWDAELLVIDNNSTDHTRDVVASAAVKSPLPLRYILEPIQGASHVRNRAISEARFEHIVYLDDDMTSVAPDWLDAYANALETFQPDCVVGPVHPHFEHPPAPGLTPDLLRCTAEYSRKGEVAMLIPPAQAHEIPGCNFAVRRSAVIEVGGFHPDLGPVGGKSIRGEDFEFGEQLVLHGKRVAFVPGCRISHLVSASKMSETGLRTRWRGDGATDRYLLRVRGGKLALTRRFRLFGRLLRFLGTSWLFYLRKQKFRALKYELNAVMLHGFLSARAHGVRPRARLDGGRHEIPGAISRGGPSLKERLASSPRNP